MELLQAAYNSNHKYTDAHQLEMIQALYNKR